MAVNIVETGFQPEIDNPEDYVEHLTPWQIEIFKQRAMGLTRNQIAEKFGKSSHTIRNIVAYTMDQETTSATEIIYCLMKTGKIDKAELSEGFDFGKYRLLSDRDRDIVEATANQEYWGQTKEEIARSLGISSNIFKDRMEVIRRTLGVSSVLRLRVFMFLKAERDVELQSLSQTVDVLPVASPSAIRADELRDWRQRTPTYMPAGTRRQKLVVARAS